MGAIQINTALKNAAKKAALIKELSKEVQENFETVGKYTYDKLTELTQTVERKTQELAEINQTYSDTKARKDVELRLDIRENELQVMSEIAVKNGRTVLSNEEYSRLNSAAFVSDADLKKAIGSAVAMAKREVESKNNADNADSQVTIKTLEAELGQERKQVKFLMDEVTRLRTQITEHNDTVVKVAQSTQNTVVTGGK